MNKSIIVQLTAECFEVSSVEILWKNAVSESVNGMKDQKSSAPLDDGTTMIAF